MTLNPNRVKATLKGMMTATDGGAESGRSLEQALEEWDLYQASLPYSTDAPPEDPFGDRNPQDEREAYLQRWEESDEGRRMSV